MKRLLTSMLFLTSVAYSSAQNQNISQGNVFDGEPYLTIDPHNSQHMVVAWMGFVPFNQVAIKTKVSFDAGQTWSNENYVEHTNALYGSADPSLAFDNDGNVYLCLIDFSAALFSGSVFVVKSTDGGLNWEAPVEVINANADPGQFPVDRPWISIDRSGGAHDGNIYVTTMPPNVFGPLAPPYHPYFMRSTDGGISFDPWKYLDDTDWLSGSLIQQPMPTNCVSADGTYHAVYPSYVISQNLLAQCIIASSSDAGDNFSYHSVYASANVVTDTLAKKGYLLRADPTDADHLALLHLDVTHGDIDVMLRESFDAGVNWSASMRVNDDPVGNDRMQDLIWADFDLDGDLVVSWRDRRNATDSTYTTATEIWGAVRWADSSGFSPNFMLSDASVAYDTILARAGNDFMCIELMDDTLSAVWGDTRNGKLNIWFQRMALDGTAMAIHQISSENVPEVNVYPNPGTSEMTVEGEAIQEIVVYDQNGKIVSIHRNTEERMVIDVENLSSGTYQVVVRTVLGSVSEKFIRR